MRITAYYSVSGSGSLNTTTEEIAAYVAENPGIFEGAEPFPLQADLSDEDYLDVVHAWLTDNTVVFENFETEEDSAPEYTVDEVQEG